MNPISAPSKTASPAETCARVLANIESVVKGQAHTARRMLAAFAGEGHVLLEDIPGTGKTTLAKALARSLGASFRRVQFTPDLLPSDILGFSIYDERQKALRFQRGPVFTHILLADEINRASPRTQSALLESMGEGQVSVDGETYRLEDFFFVIATQNPIESHGTYPLPEAQMDRFMLRLAPGYVEADVEVDILTSQESGHPLESLPSCASPEDALALRRAASEVRLTEEIKRYIVELARATRAAPGVRLGASPRASLALMKAARAAALVDGRSFVTPDDVQGLAAAVLAHRLVLEEQARFSGVKPESAVEEALRRVPAPA